MKFVKTISLICLTSLPVIVALSLLSPANAQLPNNSVLQPINPDAPNNLHPEAENSSILSIEGGKRLMTEASNAIASQNYNLAVNKLQDARIVFNQLSNFYQELNSSFSGIDNRVADAQRQKALEAAEMRDQATYQLALVHRSQNKPELAIPLLIQIIKSENPTRDLGKKSYQQLVELGFVNSSYPTTGTYSPPSSHKK